MSESQHLVLDLNETMEEHTEMGDGMNLEHQSSVDRQLVAVITEQEQVRELHMEIEEHVLAVISAETEESDYYRKSEKEKKNRRRRRKP